VERAKQERQQKIVQAEGEAEAAKMISFAMEMHVIFFTNVVSRCFVF
jgi:prohibitin 2